MYGTVVCERVIAWCVCVSMMVGVWVYVSGCECVSVVWWA